MKRFYYLPSMNFKKHSGSIHTAWYVKSYNTFVIHDKRLFGRFLLQFLLDLILGNSEGNDKKSIEIQEPDMAYILTR